MHYDVIIIGSGFGGSVTALRLSEKGYSVAVMESGKRFTAADYPRTNWNLRRFFWFPRLGMRGIQRMTLLHDVLVLSGAGVGGGSLVYANTLYEPHDAFYQDRVWADITDWKTELAPFFDQAKRMLGSTLNPKPTPADRVLQDVAAHFGVEDTYQPTPVGVFFGEPGEDVARPVLRRCRPGAHRLHRPAADAWSGADSMPRTHSTATTSTWPRRPEPSCTRRPRSSM